MKRYTKRYTVGTRTIDPAPDITTPEAALVDARNVLYAARWQALDGPEAIYQLLVHATGRLDAEIARQLRAQPPLDCRLTKRPEGDHEAKDFPGVVVRVRFDDDAA